MNLLEGNKFLRQFMNVLERFIVDASWLDRNGELKGMKIYVHTEDYGPAKFRVYDYRDRESAVIEIPKDSSEEIRIIDGTLKPGQKTALKSWMAKKNKIITRLTNVEVLNCVWPMNNEHLTG